MLGKNFRKIRSPVLQFIKYKHIGTKSDFDNFGIREVIFFS